MALNNTYFETKGRDITNPIPDTPGYVPPIVPTPPTPGSGSTPIIPRPTYSGVLNVTFYNNASDPDTLDKNITSITSKSIVVKDELDILHFRVPFNDTTIYGANYALVNGRYYYCKTIIDAGGLTWMQFDIDALMSFNDQIKGLSAIIERTGNRYNTYLDDHNVKLTAYNNIHTIESTLGFSSVLKYYLLTIGGKPVVENGGE